MILCISYYIESAKEIHYVRVPVGMLKQTLVSNVRREGTE